MTVCWVVTPPLHRIVSSAWRGCSLAALAVSVASWMTNRRRRFRSGSVVVGLAHSAGKSSARCRTASCSAAVKRSQSRPLGGGIGAFQILQGPQCLFPPGFQRSRNQAVLRVDRIILFLRQVNRVAGSFQP